MVDREINIIPIDVLKIILFILDYNFIIVFIEINCFKTSTVLNWYIFSFFFSKNKKNK